MSSARKNFLNRLRAYSSALKIEALTSKDPTEKTHNVIASILRNGVCVTGFAILEEFLKSRTNELLSKMPASALDYSGLPLSIQKRGTVRVINALSNQMRLRTQSNEDIVSYIQNQAKLVASTADSAFKISDIAFGYDKSNIGAQDIKELLGDFQISQCWDNIDAIAAKVGLSSPSHVDDFKNYSFRRHVAAHQASANTPLADLESFCRSAMGIAIGFDLLLSFSVFKITNRDDDLLNCRKKINECDIPICFIDKMSESRWRIIKYGASRAIRRVESLEEGFDVAIRNMSKAGGGIIARDMSKTPIEWFAFPS